MYNSYYGLSVGHIDSYRPYTHDYTCPKPVVSLHGKMTTRIGLFVFAALVQSVLGVNEPWGRCKSSQIGTVYLLCRPITFGRTFIGVGCLALGIDFALFTKYD